VLSPEIPSADELIAAVQLMEPRRDAMKRRGSRLSQRDIAQALAEASRIASTDAYAKR
jgi:hypothetical protein